jgi:hypothetical protein
MNLNCKLPEAVSRRVAEHSGDISPPRYAIASDLTRERRYGRSYRDLDGWRPPILHHSIAPSPQKHSRGRLCHGDGREHEPIFAALEARSLGDLWARSRRGGFGGPLQALCTEWPSGAAQLEAFVGGLLEPVLGMEKGLNHCDLYPFHAGRRASGEMLLFDLEDTGYDARFYDVSLWLGAPDEIQRRCAPRQKLAECYLAEYVRRGGSRVSEADFRAETSALWRAWTAWSMYLAWWSHRLLEKGNDPARVLAGARDRDHGMEMCRFWMHRELTILRRVLTDANATRGSR